MIKQHQVIVSVGSNIEAEKNIDTSRVLLSGLPAATAHFIDAATSIETLPVGFRDQPNFFNTAFLLETPLEQNAFNQTLKDIEDKMGRERGLIKSGPRNIDLDIVVWDGQVLTDDYYDYGYVFIPVDELLDRYQISTE